MVRRLAQLTAVLAGALLLAACSAGTPSGPATAAGPLGAHPTTPSSPTGVPATDASGTPAGWGRCTNTAAHFSIAYPHGWFTAAPAAGRDCTLFDPAAFVIPTDTLTVLHVALTVQDEGEAAAAFLGDFDPTYHAITIRDDLIINGLHAVRYEMKTLIAGPPEPRDSKRYGYLIEHGSQTLDVFTFATPNEPRYLAWQAVVDQAAQSVRFS
jgi:hypothetical protein